MLALIWQRFGFRIECVIGVMLAKFNILNQHAFAVREPLWLL